MHITHLNVLLDAMYFTFSIYLMVIQKHYLNKTHYVFSFISFAERLIYLNLSFNAHQKIKYTLNGLLCYN